MKPSNFKGEILEEVMEQKIDVVDRRILYLLSNNCRMSNTALGKILKIKREVVAYRIKQLLNQKLITGFFTYVNSKTLGFTVHTLYVKLSKIDDEKRIVDYLMNRKEVTAVLTAGGKFDLYFDVTTINLNEFDSFFKDFIAVFNTAIQEYVILDFIGEGPAGNGFLLENEDEIKKFSDLTEKKGSTFHKEINIAYKKEKNIVEINKVDKEIIKLLQKDGRITLKEIADEAGIAPNSVKNRISELVLKGVVQDFTTLISFASLGYQWYMVMLNLVSVNENKLQTYIKYHPNIAWYVKYVGPWNFQLSIFAKDNKEFHRILNQLRTEFSGNVITFDSVLIFNQFKFENRVD